MRRLVGWVELLIVLAFIAVLCAFGSEWIEAEE